jgi:hypothetical protein
VERILQGVGGEDQGDGNTPERIFIRAILAYKLEKDEEEIQWLAGGSPIEIEKIRRFTIGQYLDLLKYKVEHTKNG